MVWCSQNRTITYERARAARTTFSVQPRAATAAGWKPAEPRSRKVSKALQAYAMLTTSAAQGAVRRIPAAD